MQTLHKDWNSSQEVFVSHCKQGGGGKGKGGGGGLLKEVFAPLLQTPHTAPSLEGLPHAENQAK